MNIEAKNRILAFLPVMKELELMGIDSVENMFVVGESSMLSVESTYIAIARAKEKYPEWYRVISVWIDGMMRKGK